jgi:hypothetical protein
MKQVHNSNVRVLVLIVAVASLGVAVSAQTPQPFPRPTTQKPTQPPPQPPPSAPATKPPPPQPNSTPATQAAKAPTATPKDDTPTEATLGAPIYPSAVYLTSYDAGRGQRFYIFGATVPYAELVGYYRTVLKQKGDELYEAPPTHQFETGKFRDEAMAFVPSVTIKDYTYGGSAGYPNPKKDGQPARFPTVIQIVPAPR